MNTFHEHLAGQLDKKLRERRVVVWYDPREELVDFVADLPPLDPPEGRGGLPRVWVQDLQTHVARYDGSFFGLKARIEPIVELELPEPLLVYLPGVARDLHQSVLMEVEKGGVCFEWPLRMQARVALRSVYTDGEIDDLLRPEQALLLRRQRRGPRDRRPDLLRRPEASRLQGPRDDVRRRSSRRWLGTLEGIRR